MATARKTTQRSKPTAKTEVVADTKIEEANAVIDKEAKEVVHNDRDLIPCLSITPGEYLFVGDKSGDLYSWVSEGDVVNMRYDDILAAIRMKRPCIYKPRIVIQDDDIVDKYPDIKDLYDQLYTIDDFTKILNLTPSEMRRVIGSLPDGAKDAVKTLAMTSIQNGSLDSVQRIRTLDQIFGTDMLLQLTN